MMSLVNSLSDILWTYVILVLLIGCAIYFTIRTKGFQFRMIGEMVRIITGKDKKGQAKKGNIGSFQAFAVSLASRVGTGNLAGVASAIFVGGPGAVFWMWMMALFGAATGFVESTLAQLFKRRGKHSFYGGPAYYMGTGLGKKWMGVLFSILMVFTFGLANNIVQSNTIVQSLNTTMGWNKIWVAAAISLAIIVIVVGGVRRISKVTSILVPIMAFGYILLAIVVICMNIKSIPHVFNVIFSEAFGIRQVGGGMVGAAILQGVKRGLFSNEAGEGSAPNAAAIADTSHPAKQGLVQAFGVFVDTLLICSCTAFIILIPELYTSGEDGIVLTISSLGALIGPVGQYFVTIAVFLFAFSTIISNYFYGENNILFVTKKKWVVWLFRAATVGVLMYGAIGSLQEAWAWVDIFMGLLTLCNLVAIALLGKYAFRLLEDYRQQKKDGKEPVFHKSMIPEIADKLEAWDDPVDYSKE